MKKSLIFLLIFLLSAALPLFAHASAHDGLCPCGREFSPADTEDYMIFDCLGCGRNYTSCTCRTCWCGTGLTRTETESGITVTTCNGCTLPCEECICRDRSYYDALQGVDQGLTGEEIPNPDSGIVTAFACLLPFALFFAAYFTVYRRRSATRARKDRAPGLEQDLDRIDKETDPFRRYLLAKELETLRKDGDTRILNREGKVLCHRKNELLAEAVEEEWIREAVSENLRHCRMMNEIGFAGSVETADRLWDFDKKEFSPDRSEISGETPGQSLVKWDTRVPAIALFETVTPLNNERESNLLQTASNTTRFGVMLPEKELLMNRKYTPENADDIRRTLEALVPGGNIDALMELPRRVGDTCKPPVNLPGEATFRRMGDKNRFPGGMTE